MSRSTTRFQRRNDSLLHSSSVEADGKQEEVSWNEMKVAELKIQLKSRNLPVSGVKAVLIQRLEEHRLSLQPPIFTTTTAKTSRYFNNDIKQSTTLKGSKLGSAKAKETPLKTPESPPQTPSKKKSRNLSPTVTPDRNPTKKAPKSTSSSTRKKRIKIIPGSLPPPPNWDQTYKLVEELRSDRSAPVDTDGGEELPEKHLGPVIYRFQVLVALMLSSQTKDAVVGETMRSLQKHGLTVQTIHATNSETLNALIGKVGFHNNKTKFLKESAEIIIEQHNGDIPRTAEEMMRLPGVGPKMAYIVENIAFGIVSGIGVDTHMHRIFNDLKWVDSKTPEKTREQLEGWLPRQKWGEVNWLWVGFGQEVQQQKEKTLRKALACSDPKEALVLIGTLKVDVKKEGKKFGLEEEIEKALSDE